MIECYPLRRYIKLMIIILIVFFFSSTLAAEVYVANKKIGLNERVLVRGGDYIRMCSNTVVGIESGELPEIDGCLLYTEGLRTGYGKATTEVITKAALLNISKDHDDWEKALSSDFYQSLKSEMGRCNLGVSTPKTARALSKYIKANGLESDFLASIFFNFLKDRYKECE
ncbi:hypothetical protein [Alloalcanivorax marinus]|uniref:hypothetical protein n=1 Tax=Alloalcanivorax marinus TaxID=1177169 RepID=UPI0019311918|nr:hypothetical protein [Alloalcanivorax marinus]MBL7252586.1 hypothetical protein [Alloalcanivorax marinus]